jgi:hypothetical protein
MPIVLLVADNEALRSTSQLVAERDGIEMAGSVLKDALSRIAEKRVARRLCQLRVSHSRAQADDLVAKPIDTVSLGKFIYERISRAAVSRSVSAHVRVAFVVQNEPIATIQCWVELIDYYKQLTCPSFNVEDHAGHLPIPFSASVNCLRVSVRPRTHTSA